MSLLDDRVSKTLFIRLAAHFGPFPLRVDVQIASLVAILRGKFPERFPPRMRIAAIIQAIILAFLGGVVLIRAGLLFLKWISISTKLI